MMYAILVLNVVGAILVLLNTLRLIATARMYGGLRRCPFKHAVRLSLRGKKAVMVLAVPIVLAALTWQLIRPELWPPFPIGLQLGVIAYAFGTAYIPPSVLFLANSNDTSFRLALNTARGFMPLRTIHLLDADKHRSVAENFLGEDMNRVYDWHAAIRELVNTVPIIVFDARSITHAVGWELKHLTSRTAEWSVMNVIGSPVSRLVLVVDDDPMTSLGLGYRDLQGACTVTESQFLSVACRFGWGAFTMEWGEINSITYAGVFRRRLRAITR